VWKLELSNGSGSQSLTLLSILALTMVSTALTNASSEVGGWVGASLGVWSGFGLGVWPGSETVWWDLGCVDAMGAGVEGADMDWRFRLGLWVRLLSTAPVCKDFWVVCG